MPYDAVDASYIFKRRASVDYINPNMPIRCLEYIARLYEQFYKSKEKYSRKQLAIPTPEFYVFYNGQDEYPNETILHLSDAFMTKPTYVPLELEVKVLNINKNHGNKILQRCKPLAE